MRGLFPDHKIKMLADNGNISALEPLQKDQFQPASLDLRLGNHIFRIRSSFLPGDQRTIHETLPSILLHEMSLEEGAVLETGCVYLAEIQENLYLDPSVQAIASPKSSTGRIDVFTRLITDYTTIFDRIKFGYHGALYIEISPQTFPILVRKGSRLAQIRLFQKRSALSDMSLALVHEQESLIISTGNPTITNGLLLSVDLKGKTASQPIGYRAKLHSPILDVDRPALYKAKDFWEPLYGDENLILDPGSFYILSSQEALSVPPLYAAEMIPFDPLFGEFRVHYAGFFDPGFGYSPNGSCPSRAVLELRSHDVPFMLEHGQKIARIIYEHVESKPTKLYGQEQASNYQGQGLKLSKHFS